MRRGRAAKGDDSDFDVSASDVEDTELSSWLEKPGKSMALQVLSGPTEKTHKIFTTRKCDGAVSPLRGYKAVDWGKGFFVQTLVGENHRTFYKRYHVFKVGSHYTLLVGFFRYSTFLRVYQQRWADILKFRQKTLLQC